MKATAILRAAAGAALALAACTPEHRTTDSSDPRPSASPTHSVRAAGVGGAYYGASIGSSARRAAARRAEEQRRAQAAEQQRAAAESNGETSEHGGFGESGTAGEGG